MVRQRNTSTGVPKEPNELYAKLYNFIDSIIDGFIPPSNYIEEDDITLAMSIYLDDKSEQSNNVFRFINQAKRTDIGVYIGRSYNPNQIKKMCWIEAKRLPTLKRSDRDEREYVFVDHSVGKFNGNGGVERFKLNKHGAGLPVAIMFGYVQKETFAHWENKVNEWLGIYSTTPPFNQKEQLGRIENQNNRFKSVHKRINKDEQPMPDITLYHFWIKIL